MNEEITNELMKLNESIIDNVLSGLDSANKTIGLLIDRVKLLELRVLELERDKS